MTPTIRITQAEAVKERRLTRALKEAALGELARARNPGLERQCESYREEVIALGMDVDRLRVDLYAAQALVERLTAERDTYRAAAEGRPLERPREREKLPDTRYGWNWHMRLGDRENGLSPHVHVNLYPDGRVGELWVELDDAERHMLTGGWADAAAMLFSVGVQWGAPVAELAQKLVGLRGGPGGAVWWRPDTPEVLTYAQEQARPRDYVPDPDVSRCLSLLDAIGKKLLVKFDGHEPFGPR